MFKDMVEADIHSVFLNLDEFAERRNLRLAGVEYENIPMVFTGFREEDRHRLTTGLKDTGGRSSYSDHIQGLYMHSLVIHMAQDVFTGGCPEKGMKLGISEREGSYFYRDYLISEIGFDMGMLRIECQQIDE